MAKSVTVPRLVNCFRPPEKWEGNSAFRWNFAGEQFVNAKNLAQVGENLALLLALPNMEQSPKSSKVYHKGYFEVWIIITQRE